MTRTISGSVAVFSEESAQRLEGIELITGTLRISGNIEELPPLSLKGVGALAVENSQLRDLKGLSQLVLVATDITIRNNSALRSLDGLQGISEVPGELEISKNPALETVLKNGDKCPTRRSNS